MKLKFYFIALLLITIINFVDNTIGFAQNYSLVNIDTINHELAFISDNQQPMNIEKVILKSNNNLRATMMIFNDIIKQKPNSLFLLGDVVSLGYRKWSWDSTAKYINECRQAKINIHATLGNHELIKRKKKGIRNFMKVFPDYCKTGYSVEYDSLAILMLNSNLKKLNKDDFDEQIKWYNTKISELDSNRGIKFIVVCCHHSPFTNSKDIKFSKGVQHYFVSAFINSKKCKLFLSGHSHAFEYFKYMNKDFLVIGGGGGLHHHLYNKKREKFEEQAIKYKPIFHYLMVKRENNKLIATSRFLKNDFTELIDGYKIVIE